MQAHAASVSTGGLLHNRFVELEREAAIPLALSIRKILLGKRTGIKFVDSTPFYGYAKTRIHIHKTFRGIARRGKSSRGVFLSLKLHLLCNKCGKLLNLMIALEDV